MVFHVTQISDTHLSRARPFFQPNFACVARHLAASRCDLVINTGDIALDGAERPDDLWFAREQHETLGVPFRVIPGNHDLGDNPVPGHAPRQAITDGRRAAYRAVFGEDWWSIDREGWRLVGLNAQLLGSGLPVEEEQWAFLRDSFASAGARSVALFTHKPLFLADADETPDVWYRYVARGPRQRLLDLSNGARVRVIACGHVHQHRRAMHDDSEHVWAPSSAFVLDDKVQARLGDKRVGFVDYVFDADRVSITMRVADGMVDHDLAHFPQAYDHHAIVASV
jgi:3',5'-cyclic AMP phosphodiesterase CpdA